MPNKPNSNGSIPKIIGIGVTTIVCRGEATANRITHMDYFKMATRRYPS